MHLCKENDCYQSVLAPFQTVARELIVHKDRSQRGIVNDMTAHLYGLELNEQRTWTCSIVVRQDRVLGGKFQVTAILHTNGLHCLAPLMFAFAARMRIHRLDL